MSDDPYAGAVETHTGAVLFVGELAYKVKKPVEMGFVDWRSLDARRAACEREVELNRRLAPDVYLGVGELRSPGWPPEPAVVMRRLPAARRLSTLVQEGADVEAALRHLTHQLAAFHLAAPTTELAAAQATADATLGRWETNHRRLQRSSGRGLDATVAEEVIGAARSYVVGRGPLFRQRVLDGWARDGHGDLLADDIFCLDDGPRALDCLDFDDRLRVGDVLADVAFLAMDLERLGRGDLGRLVLDLHKELTADTWPASLAHHHIAYRAQVRAMVSAIRADQGDQDAAIAAEHLLDLAARHLRLGRVRLILIGGAPGTGKSTLAAGLGDALGAVVLRSDETRKELADVAPGARAAATLRTGIYTDAWSARTYQAMLDRAGRLLGLGEMVVLDASWLDGRWRARARAVGDAAEAEIVELRCVAPVDVAARRAATRAEAGADASDADAGIAQALAAAAPPWPEATDIPTVGTVATSLRAALERVRG